MNKKLEVKNLQISFRTKGGTVKAVRDISFDLYAGETFAIVGESGSGKSVTSKAIMGILAGNSIVENGKILYDGQDLLKISEDDFHKIRGDKIAMIFQDPMSSLNPIMRVGQQLTEAMILKAKSGRRNARHAFNTMLKYLQHYIDEAHSNDPSYDPKATNEQIKIFDKFCIESTRIESVYNEAWAAAVALELDIDNILFLMDKRQTVDITKKLKAIYKRISLCIHPYVLINDEKVSRIFEKITQLLLVDKTEQFKDAPALLREIKELIHEAANKQKPNFFRLGFYKMYNPETNTDNLSIDELDEMTGKYLNEQFMYNFIDMATKAVETSHARSLAVKKSVLAYKDEVLNEFRTNQIDRSTAKEKVKHLCSLVQAGIDRLIIRKNSTEYVFTSAIKSAINNYYKGIKNNPVETARYEKDKAKHQSIIDKGKTPEWVVRPAVLVDLELALANISAVINSIVDSINHDFEVDKDFDAKANVVEIIDFMKEQASRVVVKMNKKIAKAKAIKLLEEVGIPEPNIRFRQYPFEFSGGMRQRIVIAIALSANPDILICDEPTTALDVTIQSQILELINRIKEERKLSVIFITHNLGVVANMADRIAVMYAGKIVEYGKADEVFYEPRHPYTWALLSSMPDLHTKEKLESIPGTPPNMIYPPKGDAFAPRNKYALEIDFELEPPMFEITETHYAATWLLHPNAPEVKTPKIITDRVQRMREEMEKHD